MNNSFKNIKIILLLFFTFTFNASFAQMPVASVLNQKNTSIDVQVLVGYWQITDSLKTKIEFIDSSWYQLILDLKDNSNPYFFTKDTLNTVSSSGYYPNWPILSCNINLIDLETLELIFSPVGGAITYKIKCKKIR
jgi:hypothetical protein